MFSINMTMWESSPILCVCIVFFSFACISFVTRFDFQYLKNNKNSMMQKATEIFQIFFAFKEGYNEQFFNVNLDFLGEFFFQNACFFSCSLRSTNFQSRWRKSLSKRNFFFISEIRLYFFKNFFWGVGNQKIIELKTRCVLINRLIMRSKDLNDRKHDF